MAVTSSQDVKTLVRQIRERGLNLSLVLSCEEEEHQDTELQLISRQERIDGAFRLDGQDVSILKSLGIDPTRSAPRRKSSS
jgi:hypothetical protein